ncbi:hypothetical protein LOTGIDRAFT_231492 [Lottia gigantea]|uniref:Uncharacterized protein n=1 Tax=Lottia gigantea TaxID=225164 RepID=V4AR30_LOTGI|nr:hypothetical protein LOTGIDRAFT_231492 [Lottia gigantea]ESO97285.1 hypothetical protein LOTGIDRAFT_231492 [Lottia gigantea]
MSKPKVKDDEQILRQVRYEVTELRKLGEDWGMSSGQINQCINEAFCQKLTSGSKITEKIAKNIQEGTKWIKIRLVFRIWLVFIITVFGLVTLTNHTEYFGKAVDKMLQPYGYPIFRVVRLLSLPLHHYNISSYHNRECVVPNPYFYDQEDECLCQGITKVRVTKLRKEKELGKEFFEIPILFKGLQKELVPFEKVIKLVQDEYEILKDPSLLVDSSVDWIKNIGDLNDIELKSKMNKEENFHVEWNSRRMSTSQTLRTLFPRPVIYPKKIEVVITRSLYVAGPHADGILLTENQAADLFYIQGWGTRTVVFTPRKTCEDVCDSFSVKTEPGDVLMFANSWDVKLLPNEEGISVSFMGGVA